MPTPTRKDTERFLETVYGHGDGWIHLSTTRKQVAAVECSRAVDLAAHIMGKTDVYLSAAVIGGDTGSGEGGRTSDVDAAQLTALWVDLDRAGEPGHKTAADLWTRQDLKNLWETLPIHPTVVVDSGGGWWFYYVLTEPVALNENGSGELLLARWARWWQTIGEEHGRHLDGVWNPSRIVRAPGSVNRKEDGKPAFVKSNSGERISLDTLDELLPAPQAPTPTTKSDVEGERPGDTYNQDTTVEDMVTLLQRHGFHSPRPKGSRVDLTRPGKNARDGHSVTVWPDAAVTFWSSAPEALPGTITLRDKTGASGTYDPFGVFTHIEHRGDWTAAAAQLNPATEIVISNGRPPTDGGTLADLLNRILEPIRFVIDGLIPEGLTILAGKPKLGKSWLALGMALAVCSGNKALNHDTTLGEVLYLSLEDGERRIQDRVRFLGGDHLGDHLGRFHYRVEWPPLDQGGIDHLDQWMTDHPDTRLIVIDTYGRIRGDLPGRDKYAEEYGLVGKIQAFATRHRVAVVLVHHLRKQAADDWLEQLSGSQAITGAADTLLGLFRERGQMDATLRLVSRELEERDIALKFDGGRWESMGDAEQYRMSVERQAIVEAITDLGGEARTAEIAEHTEKSSPNVSKMLAKLEKEGVVQKIRHGTYSLTPPGKVVNNINQVNHINHPTLREGDNCPVCDLNDGYHAARCTNRPDHPDPM